MCWWNLNLGLVWAICWHVSNLTRADTGASAVWCLMWVMLVDSMMGFYCEYTGASAVIVSSAGYDGNVSSASSMGWLHLVWAGLVILLWL